MDRQAITRAIADQARTIRVPVHMIQTMGKVRSVTRDLVQRQGREPSVEETADAAGLTIGETYSWRRSAASRSRWTSRWAITTTATSATSSKTTAKMIRSTECTRTCSRAARRHAGRVNYREREIIRLRYGLADGYAYTLEEVGKIFSVTRERVRQIEAEAVRKLQHPIRSHSSRASWGGRSASDCNRSAASC